MNHGRTFDGVEVGCNFSGLVNGRSYRKITLSSGETAALDVDKDTVVTLPPDYAVSSGFPMCSVYPIEIHWLEADPNGNRYGQFKVEILLYTPWGLSTVRNSAETRQEALLGAMAVIIEDAHRGWQMLKKDGLRFGGYNSTYALNRIAQQREDIRKGDIAHFGKPLNRSNDELGE